MKTTVANEYSTEAPHNENIVSLDPESIVGNLQNYLDRDRKKSLINQANHYLKRLSISKAILSNIQNQVGIETPKYYEIKTLLESIEENIELIKDDEKVGSFGNSITQVAKLLSDIEQKVVSFSADSNNEINSLREELASYDAKIGEKVEEIKQLEEKILSIKSVEVELENSKQELVFAKNELRDREKSTTAISSDLNESVREMHVLKTQLSDKEIELREARASLNMKMKENSEFISEILTMEMALSTIKDKYHEIRTENEELAEKSKELKEMTNGNVVSAKIQAADTRINELERSFKRQEAIADSKSQEVEALNAELLEANSLLKEKNNECKILKDDISKKKQKFERSKMSTSDAMYQMEMAKRGLDKANEKIDYMGKEFSETSEKLKAKELELSELTKNKSNSFIGKKAFYIAISVAIILSAILSVVLFAK